MNSKKSNLYPQNSNVEYIFEKITSTDRELHLYFKQYLEEEYEGDLSKRIAYYDIARIGDYIKNKLSANQTSAFASFFNSIEEILKENDLNANNLIVIGLFESLQNHTESSNPSYSHFNKWLGPISKKEWDNLIDFWSGKKVR
jgi:hypothetical protein